MDDLIRDGYCLPRNIDVSGLMEQEGARYASIRLSKCEEEHLLPGDTCMNSDELDEYFRNISPDARVLIFYTTTFIDYQDLDMPV